MITDGVVCGVLACRSEDQLYCASRGRCEVAAVHYCNGRDYCGGGIDEPANCGHSALSLSLSLSLSVCVCVSPSQTVKNKVYSSLKNLPSGPQRQ